MKKVLLKKSQLKGAVTISGAKNSALKLLVASLLTNEEVVLDNFPSNLDDIIINLNMFDVLNKKYIIKNNNIKILEENLAINNVMEWNERSIRNTLLILGVLTARTGYAKVPLPGGCNIGTRGYDLHQMLLEKLGAKVTIQDNYIIAEAPHGLKGSDIKLPIRSTGATENAILSSCLAKGTTRIWNPHVRPEILELIAMLRQMGAIIEVRGQESILVTGVDKLNGTKFRVMPDNIEALTYLIGSVITEGDVEILDFPFKHLEIPLIFLRESGAKFYIGENSLIVRGGQCFPIELSTGPYPGINSDMQPLLAVYAICAKGESKIIDLRFPDRFDYLKELRKMGAQYKIDNNIAIIKGSELTGTKVTAIDLRGGAALLLAALIAEGETVIENFEQVLRGYENVVLKMQSLGADIKEI